MDSHIRTQQQRDRDNNNEQRTIEIDDMLHQKRKAVGTQTQTHKCTIDYLVNIYIMSSPVRAWKSKMRTFTSAQRSDLFAVAPKKVAVRWKEKAQGLTKKIIARIRVEEETCSRVNELLLLGVFLLLSW